MADIAHGVIQVEARDEGALASLRRVEAQFDRTMHNIDRQEAEVRILADAAQFGKEMKKARAELDELKAARAEIKLDADKRPLDRKIRQLEKDIAFVDRLKAEVDIGVSRKTAQEAQSAISGIARLEEARARAEQKYHDQRMRVLNAEARRRASLSDQRIREFRQDEAAAHRMDVQRDNEAVQVLRLQREYAKLTDRIEALNKRNAFTREARAKLTLDTAEAYAKMEATKAALNRLGAHPPVDIKVDLDRKGIKRVTGFVGDIGRKILQGVSNLPNATVRLGPFTTSLKGLTVALGFLGPTLIDVMGAATSLIGVLGTGLTGAAGVAGGVLSGLVLNLVGVKESLNPLIKDFKINTQLVDAYHKAVLKYGKGSDEAIKAQDQMNHALATMDPKARAAAKAVGSLGTTWQGLTRDQANQSFVHVVGQYAKTVKALQPTLAANANTSMRILDRNITSTLQKLRSPAAIHIFDSLGSSANSFLGPALRGLEHLGAAAGRFAESFARIFAGRAGRGFEDWAAGVDRASQDTEKLDGTVRRLGNHAKDLGAFFLETGRLIKNILNVSADSGDGLLQSMTKTEKKWNEFLTSAEGKNTTQEFFERSADGARALWHAITPIVHAFTVWATGMAPFITAATNVFSFLSRIVAKITDLVGLGGSVSTFAATLGTLWAVGKIGAFVAMVGRAITAVRTLGAVTTATSLLTGSFGRKAAEAGVGLRGVAAVETLASRAPVRNPVPARSPSGIIIPPGAARETENLARSGGRAASAFSRFKGAAGGAVAALTGLNPVAAAGVVAVGALTYGIYKLATQEDDWANNERNAAALHDRFVSAVAKTPATMAAAAQANLGYSQAVRSVTTGEHAAADAQARVDKLRRQGKQGTAEYKQAVDQARMAQDSYKQSLIDEYSQREQLEAITAKMTRTRDAALGAARGEAAQRKQTVEDIKNQGNVVKDFLSLAKDAGKSGDLQGFLDANKDKPGAFWQNNRENLQRYIDALDRYKNAQAEAAHAQDLWTLSGINAQRATAGLVPIADSAAAAVGNLVQKIGRTQTAKIALKFPDAKQAAQAMQGVNRAVKSGVSGKAAVNVVTNAPNIAAALRGLNQIRLTPKNLRIIEQGGKEAVRRLEMIAGRKLTKHELKIAEAGGPKVLALLDRLNGKKLANKILTMYGVDRVSAVASKIANVVGRLHGKSLVFSAVGNALSQINSIASAVGRLHDRTITVTTNYVQHGHARTVGSPTGWSGGIFGAAARGADFVARAAERAQAKGAKTTHGGKYGSPTLLVGEEDRTEYVIATNPAYRENNKRYLSAAANDLGMMVVEAAANGTQPGVSAAGNKKKHPKKHKTPKVPARYRFAGVPEDVIQKQYDAAKTARQNMEDRADSKHSEAKSASKKKKPGLLADEKKLRDKVPGLRAKENRLKRDLDAVKRVNRRIDMLNLQIEGERTAMEAAAKGDKLAGPKNKKYPEGTPLAPDGKSFEDHRKSRQGYMKTLRGILKQALKHGASGQYAQTIKNEIASINSELIDVKRDQGYVRETTDRTVDDFLKDSGFYDDIAREQKELALDRAATPGDPSTWTGDALTDYLSDQGKLADTYKKALDKAKADNVDPGLITELADLYSSARDASLPPSVTSEDSTGLIYSGAVADSLRSDVLRDFGGNTSSNFGGMALGGGGNGPAWTQQNPAALNPSAASGTGFGGNTSQSGGGVTKVINQTNNFQQPPADAHTFSQGVAFELGAAI